MKVDWKAKVEKKHLKATRAREETGSIESTVTDSHK